jgi:transcriptional regulator with XRE-family HTH domain/pimeloyl-ACP methyl ester carboxylesterase
MAQESAEINPVQDRARRLGADLRDRRRAAGLTQQALADRIGYERSYLSQVETGGQIPAEQFVLQCERELAAGGDLLGMFQELLVERETRRQQAHTKRWQSAVGESLRVEQISPRARELKTLQFVAWAAEHSRLSFQEVYDAVVAHAALLEGLAPSARHAQVHRRSRVTREQITQALHAYYHSSSMDDGSAAFYHARVSGVPLTLSILVERGWLGLGVRLGSDQEQFRLAVPDPNSAVGTLEGGALEAALARLANVEVNGTVLVNSPLYRLLDAELGQHRLEAVVSLAEFAAYALTMDLLETELVDALATTTPGRVSDVEPGFAGCLPLRDIYLPTVASALALGKRLCVGGPVALLAAARGGTTRRQGAPDYVLLIQERSARVLNATGRLAVVPKAFHGPTVEAGQEARLSASLERELEEELLGRQDLEGLLEGSHRQADPFHRDRLSEPMRWLLDRRDTDAYRVECVGFGINMVSGNFEFPCLILIDDEEWWARYGGQVNANWELEQIRRYSSRDTAGLQALITDPRWSNEGLFAFLEGLRRLATVGSVSRLALPTIEMRRDGG